MCVGGCLPPDVLGHLADERGREDGFIHRILFAFPDAVAINWTEACVSESAQEQYREGIQALLRLQGRDPTSPRVITFTPRGRQAFIEFAATLYGQLNSPDSPSHLRGPFAKLEGYCARPALILQLSRQASGETDRESVEEASVLGAAALVHYFQSHARRVYAQLRSTPDDRRVEQALTWIQAHGGKVTAREVLSSEVAGVKSASEAKALLLQLEDRGYGAVMEEGRHRVRFALP